MKEVFPDLTEEQLEEWFNSRQSDASFRGPGMMRAIEAARAGEHGKGFAVVAGEVGRLAEQ